MSAHCSCIRSTKKSSRVVVNEDISCGKDGFFGRTGKLWRYSVRQRPFQFLNALCRARSPDWLLHKLTHHQLTVCPWILKKRELSGATRFMQLMPEEKRRPQAKKVRITLREKNIWVIIALTKADEQKSSLRQHRRLCKFPRGIVRAVNFMAWIAPADASFVYSVHITKRISISGQRMFRAWSRSLGQPNTWNTFMFLV